MDASGPNAEQIRYWNEVRGPTWAALAPLIDAQLGPLGRHAMDRAAVAPGERVLDVGCGCGDTTVELARRVGPAGAVTGVDLSAPLLAHARARAAGVANVRFEQADAQTHAFPPAAFDLLFSRFGVMFFADPPAAFGNLRLALRPGARLAFVCWRSLEQNPWLSVPLRAAARHLPLPAPAAPDAPGPFSFAADERVRAILTGAGFARVALEPLDEVLTVGGDAGLDGAVPFLLEVGPLATVLREAGPAARPAVEAALRDVLAPFATAAGVRMPAAAWIVTARRP